MSGTQTLQDPEKLRQARIDAGLNQAQLAERAGVDQSHLSLLERGLRSATPKTLDRIAKALGGTVATLRRAAQSQPGSENSTRDAREVAAPAGWVA